METVKPTVFLESALAAQVISCKYAVFELAFDKFTVSDEGALKFASFELDVYKDGQAKVSPIPVAI